MTDTAPRSRGIVVGLLVGACLAGMLELLALSAPDDPTVWPRALRLGVPPIASMIGGVVFDAWPRTMRSSVVGEYGRWTAAFTTASLLGAGVDAWVVGSASHVPLLATIGIAMALSWTILLRRARAERR
jgi:hypothetical protein